MTTRTVMTARARRLTALAAALAATLVPAALWAQGGGGGSDAPELGVRSFEQLRRAPALSPIAARSRVRPMSSTGVTPNDSFLVVSNGFDEANGNCNPRGWTGEDLTQRVFAHVSSRFTVNDGFVNMGTKALWFGADSSSALDEISQWVLPFGYGNGWSQRLTSPTFTPGSAATLRFDVSMELRRSDGGPTSSFTPYGLASGKVGNDMMAVQAKKADGTWTNLHTRFATASSPASWDQTAPLFENRVTGSTQANPANMLAPNGIAVDDSGDVYVADRGANRILKFTKTGRFLLQWGVTGTGPGQLTSPFDVCVDHAFNVYVTDQGMRVQKFDANGNFILQWGTPGSGIGQFMFPLGVCADPANNIYVCDQGNERIQKFNSNGSPLLQWGTFGSSFGQFNAPTNIVCDATYAYVVDSGNHRIQKFNQSGAFFTMWGTQGSGDGQFSFPSGIGLDRFGDLWVADRQNHRIQRFTSNGAFLLKTGTLGSAGGHFFDTPRDIAISRDNDLYVVESGNNRYQTFAIGGPIAGEGTFHVEARLTQDGNEDIAFATPMQLRIVMQSSGRLSCEDGQLWPGQNGVILVDNLSLEDAGNADVLPPVNFEDGTTGAWTLSAFNNAAANNFTLPSSSFDFPPPATAVALRKNFDLYDKSCVWTFLSPGDSLANGVFARLVSPWIPLVPGDSIFHVRATSRLNTLLQSRFLFTYARGKNAGDTRVRACNAPSFVAFGTTAPLEASSPLENDAILFDFPLNVDAGSTVPIKPLGCDSIQIVFEIEDQPNRNLGTVPESRPTAHVPILDDIEVVQLGVDADYDGVADAFDACDSTCAAGQDADGDGCVDATATMHHVESWRAGEIHYALHDTFNAAEQAAIRAAFSTWEAVDGVILPIQEDAMTPQGSANALDGINVVTASDPDLQFPPGVLAITPTTSFTQRSAFQDRIVLPGEIVDSDLILNPQAPFTTTGESGKYDLQSVATHEVGHLLGLTHSGVLDATMFFVIQPGELARSLSPDDEAAISAAFPGPNLAAHYGTITGTITRGQTGQPLPGALVEAVRLGAGNVLADTTSSDYSAEDGSYALRRLPAGNYAVRITPLDGNVGGFPLTADYISQRLATITHDTFVPEWWSVPETDRDDPTLLNPIAVTAGQAIAGINITTTVDTIPPSVASTLPADGAGGVAIDTPILVTFSEPVLPATLEASFRLRKNGLPPSIGGTGQLRDGKTFVFTPTRALDFQSQYEIEISPALTDVEGVAMADTFRAVFGTQNQPPLAITDIQPRSAPIGGLITITGTGFDPESTLVVFPTCGQCPPNLVAASQVTPTSLVVRVIQGAVSGIVTVVSSQGVSNGFSLTVLPPAPQAAPVANGAPALLGALVPYDAAVSPDGATAYVAGDGGISTVALTTPGLPVTPRLAAALRGLALTPDGTRLVTRDVNQHKLIVMGAVPGNNIGVVLGNIVLPNPNLGDIAISPDGRRAYVPETGTSNVDEVDIDPQGPTPFALLRQLPIGGANLFGGISVSPDAASLYLSTSNEGMVQATLSNAPVVTVLNTLPTGSGAIAITPSGGEVLAAGTNNADGILTVEVPLQGPSLPGTLPHVGVIHDVGVAPEGQSAYVLNSSTNQLEVVDVDPGSPTYHAMVSTVGTGPSPVSVGISSLSSVLVVACAGDRTLWVYTAASGNGGLTRVSPDVAIVGDAVAVHSATASYPGGTQVDLGQGDFATTNAVGTAVGFVVPAGAQRATTLTLENPSHVRSLSLPFEVVDPITTFAPHATGLVGAVPSINCSNPTPEQGVAYVMRTSPDGRIMALARNLSGDCYEIDFIAADMRGDRHPGTNLFTYDNGHIPISDFAFSPDGKRLWVIRRGDAGFILDSDPASPTFGQSVADFLTGGIGHFPQAVTADPLGRFMLASNSDPGFGPSLCYYDPGTANLTRADSVNFTFSNAVMSRDGRYALLVGTDLHVLDANAKSLLVTPPGQPAGPLELLQIVTTTDGKRAVGLLTGSNVVVWNLDPNAGPIGANLYSGHPIPSNISQLIEGSDGHSVMLACRDCNSLFRLDVSVVPPVAASVDVGQSFTALTRSPDGRRLWGVNSVPTGNGSQANGDVKLWSLSDGATLSLITGGGQSGLPSSTLPVPFRVRLTAANGHPQAGAVIRFSVAGLELDGIVDQWVLEKYTDANGEAQVTWAVGPVGTPVMTITALGGTAAPLTVAATVAASDADVIPDVTQFGPLDGATNINAGSAVFARFNQSMNQSTLPQFVHLAVAGVSSVPGAFSYQDGGRFVVFQPIAPLAFSSACTLYVEPGAADLDGQLTPTRRSAAFTVQAPPTLTATSLLPAAGPVGSQVVVSGQGFSTTTSSNIVTFNGTLAPVQRATLTSLTTAVPAAATSGPVVVQVGPSGSAPLAFTVLTPNPDPGQVLGDVSDNQGLSRVAFTPDGKRAYVTNTTHNSVTVIDVQAASIITSITVGLGPRGIAILPNGTRAYVANRGSANVSVIDVDPASPTYNTVVKTIGVGDEPVDVAVSGVGPRVFVANSKSGTVSIIDANPGNATFDQVVTTVNTGAGSGAVVVSPDGGRIYVGTATAVVMVDLGSLVVTTVNTGSGAGSVAISPDGTIVIALLLNGNLVVIDVTPGSPNFNKVVTTVNTGSGAGAVSVSPDGGLAYVTSPDGNVVKVYQIFRTNTAGASSYVPGPAITLTLIGTLPVAQAPADIALSPTGSGLALVPSASGTVTFIGIPPPPAEVTVAFDFNPNTLNLKSLGQWVQGLITPPAPYGPADVVVSSVKINGLIAVDPQAPVTISGPTLTLKFSRAAVQLALPEGDHVTVTVTGTIAGHPFTGSDQIAVKTNKVNAPHAAEIVNADAPYTVRWTTPSGLHVEWVALLHSLDKGATWTLDASHLPNTGQAAWQPPSTVGDSVKVAVVVVEAADPGDTLVTGLVGVSDYFRLTTPTAVDPPPVRLEFSRITPSPSHGVVRMRYGLPRAAAVDLELYDVQGRRLRTLVSGDLPAGWHEAFWDGTSDGGVPVGSGLYFVRFRAEGRVFRQRMIWIR